jgi:hypothetical protein
MIQIVTGYDIAVRFSRGCPYVHEFITHERVHIIRISDPDRETIGQEANNL